MYCKLLEPTARLELLCNNCVFAVAGELTMTIMCVRWRLNPTLLRNVTSGFNAWSAWPAAWPFSHTMTVVGGGNHVTDGVLAPQEDPAEERNVSELRLGFCFGCSHYRSKSGIAVHRALTHYHGAVLVCQYCDAKSTHL
jgi:hypothetical protein